MTRERQPPCQYIGGHVIEYIKSKDINSTTVSIPWCVRCKSVVGRFAKKEEDKGKEVREDDLKQEATTDTKGKD